MIAVLALGLSSIAYAGGPIAYSSFTATTDSTLLRSATSTNTIVQTLTAVVVSSASAASGAVLKIYNSTWTTSNQVAMISLTTVGYYPFNDTVLKGIFYTTTGNSSGVTIIYKY